MEMKQKDLPSRVPAAVAADAPPGPDAAQAPPGGTGPGATSPWPRIALLGYGFRPFFLLAAVHAAIAMPAWMAFIHGVGSPGASVVSLPWHAHEMLYGFVMAAVAGFLLTAVPSWTGRRGFAGAPLLFLVVLWLAGRAVMSLPMGLSPVTIAAVDLAFPVALALAVVPSLVRSGSRRNFVFLVFLALLFTANFRFHFSAADSTQTLHLAVNTILLMVALVGGRIVPAFTSARLKQRGLDIRIPHHPIIDPAAIVATVSVLVVDVLAPGGTVAGVLAAVAAAALAVRLARWQGHRTFGEPILWVLHVGYGWLALGLALKAAWLLWGLGTPAGWLHALTAGAFATMILAVMSRAALGHTGRELIAPRAVVLAYLLLTASALARVFGPLVAPAQWMSLIDGAAALWSAAFMLFLLSYAPILCRPRADGLPG